MLVVKICWVKELKDAVNSYRLYGNYLAILI